MGGRQNGSRGFTLIETLVTLMILSVGLVLVLQAFQTSLRALGEARDTLWSTFVLKDAAGKASLAGKSSTSMMSASAGLWDTGHGVWKWQMTPGFAGSPRNVQTRDIETVVLHEMKILAWREDSARVEEIGLWATAIERANRERR